MFSLFGTWARSTCREKKPSEPVFIQSARASSKSPTDTSFSSRPILEEAMEIRPLPWTVTLRYLPIILSLLTTPRFLVYILYVYIYISKWKDTSFRRILEIRLFFFHFQRLVNNPTFSDIYPRLARKGEPTGYTKNLPLRIGSFGIRMFHPRTISIPSAPPPRFHLLIPYSLYIHRCASERGVSRRTFTRFQRRSNAEYSLKTGNGRKGSI